MPPYMILKPRRYNADTCLQCVRITQKWENASRAEKQEEMLAERHKQKTKQEPARGGRNRQPLVVKSRPGRTRTADQGIMSPLL